MRNYWDERRARLAVEVGDAVYVYAGSTRGYKEAKVIKVTKTQFTVQVILSTGYEHLYRYSKETGNEIGATSSYSRTECVVATPEMVEHVESVRAYEVERKRRAALVLRLSNVRWSDYSIEKLEAVAQEAAAQGIIKVVE